MAITVIQEGPIDKLNKGILAGAKFAALASGIRTQETRNQHDAQRLVFEEANSQSLVGMRAAQVQESATRNELVQAQIAAGTPAATAALAEAKTQELEGDERTEFISSLLDPSRDITQADLLAASASLAAKFEIEPTGPNMEIVLSQVRGMHSQMKAKLDSVNQRTEAIGLANVNKTAGSMPFAIQQWYVGQQAGLRTALGARADARSLAARTAKTNSRYDTVQAALKTAEADVEQFNNTLSDAVGQYFNTRQEDNVIPQRQEEPQSNRGKPTGRYTVGEIVNTSEGPMEYIGGDDTLRENWRKVN